MPPYFRGHTRTNFASVRRMSARTNRRMSARTNRSRSRSGSSQLLTTLCDRARQDQFTRQARGRRDVRWRGLRSEVQRLPSRMPIRHGESERLPGLCYLWHRGSDEGEGIHDSSAAGDRAVPDSIHLPVFVPEIRVRFGDGAVKFRTFQTEIRRRRILALLVWRKWC